MNNNTSFNSQVPDLSSLRRSIRRLTSTQRTINRIKTEKDYKKVMFVFDPKKGRLKFI